VGHVLARNQYGQYAIPEESRHRPAAQTILSGRVWEPETTAFIADRARYGDVVSAGAYFGDMLPAAAAGGNTVYAAEPNPVNFAAAQTTLELNGIDNVRLYNVAFGAKAGTAYLEIADRFGTPHGGGSWIVPRLFPRRRGARRVECRVVAIDEIVPPSAEIVLVHLDVERSETNAIRGAIRTIERWRPDLLLETRPRFGAAARALRSLGYREVARLNTNALLSAKPS
jgi:FkbM family methyltransferase